MKDKKSYNRERYLKNKEYQKKYNKKYYPKWYLKNKERNRIYHKKRLKRLRKNPEYVKMEKERLKKYQPQQRKYKKERRLRLRFEIFKRDNFTCQYCGRKAPDIILHIDHIFPKSKGGLDKQENYKSACSECNVGKCDSILNEFTKQ